MKREIDDYLRQHGDRYTPETLRQQLIEAHYDPVEIDAALEEWRAARANPAGASEKARFARFNWLIHGAALLVVVAWLALKGDPGLAVIAGIILAVALVIGAIAASVVGEALRKKWGLTAAVAVSLASALLLGGACFGLSGGLGGTI